MTFDMLVLWLLLPFLPVLSPLGFLAHAFYVKRFSLRMLLLLITAEAVSIPVAMWATKSILAGVAE